MFPLQVSLTLVAVLGYGFVMRNRSLQLRRRLEKIPRNTRAALGIACFLISALLLLGGFAGATALDSKPQDGLAPLAWVVVLFCSLGAVHLQTLAAGMMVSLAIDPETRGPAQPSTSQTDSDSSP